MCGIAGMIGPGTSEERLRAAAAAIAHRGPDASGLHRDGATGLVHTRLSILDLSEAANQPMVDADTGVAIVFNGEIYNFLELRDALTGERFATRSDTEVILRLYLHEGMACVARLRGMFAFAIWDPRSGALHLARDRFGIKPLYYGQGDGEVFRFASEAKALFALGATPRFNLPVIADYLRSGRMAHGEETFFEGVLALPPGTTMTVRDGTVTRDTYWSEAQLGDGAAGGPSHDPSDDEVDEAVWEALLDALRHHLISDVPVGISLSSGFDSRLLVHMLDHLGRDDLHAFTFGFAEPEYDEIRALDEAGMPGHLVRHDRVVRPDEVLDGLERAIGYYEAPLGGLGSLAAFLLMEQPRRLGVPVILSGEGSDETFGGYKYYYDAYFRDLYERGDHALLRDELAAYAAIMDEPPMRVGDAAFTDRVLGASGGMKAPDGTSLEGRGFLAPRLDCLPAPRTEPPAAAGGHLRAAMIRDLKVQKLPKLLWFQDRGSMAWGVETRVPFLDHPLIERVYRLSSRWMIRDGEAKYLPKRLLKKFCGVDFGNTRKHFVATPQREWLKGPLFDAVNAYLDDGALAGAGWIDYPAFKDGYARYAATTELGNSFFVWKMMNLEAFARAFPEALSTT